MADRADRIETADEKALHGQIENTNHLESDEITKSKYTANTQLDDAARLLAEAGDIQYTPAEGKRVLRRIDMYVCSCMCLVYFIQQLDKSSVSYAAGEPKARDVS
jgi:hypothetical protein